MHRAAASAKIQRRARRSGPSGHSGVDSGDNSPVLELLTSDLLAMSAVDADRYLSALARLLDRRPVRDVVIRTTFLTAAHLARLLKIFSNSKRARLGLHSVIFLLPYAALNLDHAPAAEWLQRERDWALWQQEERTKENCYSSMRHGLESAEAAEVALTKFEALLAHAFDALPESHPAKVAQREGKEAGEAAAQAEAEAMAANPHARHPSSSFDSGSSHLISSPAPSGSFSGSRAAARTVYSDAHSALLCPVSWRFLPPAGVSTSQPFFPSLPLPVSTSPRAATRTVGDSAMTSAGMNELFAALADLTKEYDEVYKSPRSRRRRRMWPRRRRHGSRNRWSAWRATWPRTRTRSAGRKWCWTEER